MQLPRLYPILDADGLIAASPDVSAVQLICSHAVALAEAGCTVLQYRAKRLQVRERLAQARELRRLLPAVTLIMNDRADLCLAAAFDGVHVGQDDLTAEAARSVVGERAIVGLSTHNRAQLEEALTGPVDYVAFGPVFVTGSKLNPDPVVGVEGVREARRMLAGRELPLVAIGGITRANARSVIEAGADAVAVIGDLCDSPRESASEFLRLMM